MEKYAYQPDEINLCPKADGTEGSVLWFSVKIHITPLARGEKNTPITSQEYLFFQVCLTFGDSDLSF